MYLDFANPAGGRKNRRLKFWRKIALVLVFAFCAVGLVTFKFYSQPPEESLPAPPVGAASPEPMAPLPLINSGVPIKPGRYGRLPLEPLIPIAGLAYATPAREQHREIWQSVAVAAGDNMSLIFGRLGLSKRDLHRILSSDEKASVLKRLQPNHLLRFQAREGALDALTYEIDLWHTLDVNRDGDDFVIEVHKTDPETKRATAIAQIEKSLFVDGQQVGLPDKTIMELTEIFGWDIDFALDIRNGDSFSVVFEEIYKNGEKVSNGRILAAEFTNRGQRLRALYYHHEDGIEGYFSDTGKAMRKTFLRTPVNFSRISSRFSLGRRHPVLNTIRAHKGVDYAAPHGTPIRATANGKVAFVGTKNGYGKTVVLRHGDTYSTLYAHMSRYARNVAIGKRVKQGDTIGYVGKTGLATGPHLHYEFLVSGVHRNPLTVDLPQASPIEDRYLADFHQKAAPLIATLDELAMQTPNSSSNWVVHALSPKTLHARIDLESTEIR